MAKKPTRRSAKPRTKAIAAANVESPIIAADGDPLGRTSVDLDDCVPPHQSLIDRDERPLEAWERLPAGAKELRDLLDLEGDFSPQPGEVPTGPVEARKTIDRLLAFFLGGNAGSDRVVEHDSPFFDACLLLEDCERGLAYCTKLRAELESKESVLSSDRDGWERHAADRFQAARQDFWAYQYVQMLHEVLKTILEQSFAYSRRKLYDFAGERESIRQLIDDCRWIRDKFGTPALSNGLLEAIPSNVASPAGQPAELVAGEVATNMPTTPNRRGGRRFVEKLTDTEEQVRKLVADGKKRAAAAQLAGLTVDQVNYLIDQKIPRIENRKMSTIDH